MTRQLELRKRLSDAVHSAVCEFTESDGVGKCLWYAAAGYLLATQVFRRTYVPQAGSLRVLIDPPDGYSVIRADHAGGLRGEYHCWFVRPENARADSGRAAEIVDLTSRHYRTYTDRMMLIKEAIPTPGGTICVLAPEHERIHWTRPEDPPDFVWTDGTFPDLMRVAVDQAETERLFEFLFNHRAEVKELYQLAQRHFAGRGHVKAVSHGIVIRQQGPTAMSHATIRRNDQCPCGSGRKFKKCCLHVMN